MKYTPAEIDRQLETVVEPVYAPDMTTTVGKLKHLRHVVERIPPKQFNIGVILSKTACGTVGCILGWAALDGGFQRLGLIPEPNRGGMGDVSIAGDENDLGAFSQPTATLFGISYDDLGTLFGGAGADRNDACITNSKFTISDAVARIDRMIEKYSAIPI